MARTKQRALVEGVVPGRHAVIFAIVLGLVGLVLLLFTNLIVVAIGLAGFFDYIVLYGMLSKRLSMHGTLVGSISGATPILAGYVAARGRIDAGAIIAFFIVFLWQQPEFYSISIFRHDEYKAAGIPVISVVKGIAHTKLQIFLYTLAFTVATAALTLFGYTGYLYLVVMMALCLYWLRVALQGFKTADNSRWARRMFRFSLVIIVAICTLMSIRIG